MRLFVTIAGQTFDLTGEYALTDPGLHAAFQIWVNAVAPEGGDDDQAALDLATSQAKAQSDTLSAALAAAAV